MVSTKDKKFINKLSRQMLLEVVKSSRHRNNFRFHKFIQEEATYNQILIAAWSGEIIHEYSPKTAERVKEIEREVRPFLRMPLSMLVGGPIRTGVRTAITRGAAAKVGAGLVGKFAIGAAGLAGGIAGGIAASMAIGWGVGLLSKVIFAMINKKFDQCYIKCKRSVFDRDPLYKKKVPVCMHKCRMAEIQRFLTLLRSERSKCKRTGNPEKCEHAILSKIIKYSTLLNAEKAKLVKAMASLEKASKKKVKRSKTAKPPKAQNISAIV